MADDPNAQQAGGGPAFLPGSPTSPPPTDGAQPQAPRSYWAELEPRRPAGPAPGFEYAGFWIRLLAYLIDLVPLLIVGFILLVPVFTAFSDTVRDIPFPERGTTMSDAELRALQEQMMQRMTEAMAPFYPAYGLSQLFSIAYFVGFWTWRGQTPGMMLLGLRVARESDGTSPGLARSILRYVGYLISGAVLFLGFIWIAFDSRKQGWHDKIAGTVVVRRTG
jgi:uncharacterized RDD family membrane protein YckC